MRTNLTRGHGAHRRLLGLLACMAVVAALLTVFSPAALGDSPDEECSSSDPAWNGEYWTVEEDDGVLGDVETNVSGATTLTETGSWINNNVNPVYRVVVETEDDDSDSEETQVVTGFWETGEGGTIEFTLDELEHVTFCFTNAGADEVDPTTTTLGTTSTTSAPGATTTTGADTVTTPAVSTPTTGPAPGPTTLPQGLSTSASDEPAGSAAANSPTGSFGGTSELADLSGDAGSDRHIEGSTSDAVDPDQFALPFIGGSGNPPVAGPTPDLAQAEPDSVDGSHQWPTLGDLAVLGSLVAAIGVVMGRRRIGRFVKSLRWQD